MIFVWGVGKRVKIDLVEDITDRQYYLYSNLWR